MRMPGKIFGEVPLIYGTQFQASFRAAEPSRVLRVDAAQYYALAALSPEFANTVRESAGERIGGLREHRRRTAQGEGHVARESVGHRLPRAAPVSRAQPDHVRLADARYTRSGGALGGRPARGERVARASSQRGSDADQAAAEATRRAPRPADETARRRIRHGDHRRRTGWPRRGRVRCFRGAAHPGRRARGAGRPGGNLIADRELSRLPERHLRRRAWRAARSGRRGVSARRSW